MRTGVQSFACPRCRRGEFRSLPGPGGKAFCPWCGDTVAASSISGSVPADEAPSEAFSLVDIAEQIAGRAPKAPGPAAPPSPDQEARLADSERRRELAETELRKEQEKR